MNSEILQSLLAQVEERRLQAQAVFDRFNGGMTRIRDIASGKAFVDSLELDLLIISNLNSDTLPYFVDLILMHSESATRSVDAFKASQRELQSLAGKRGADEKHKDYRALREWLLVEAKKASGSDKDIAHKLSARLPTHLADVSKEPERFIYDALRARRKRK